MLWASYNTSPAHSITVELCGLKLSAPSIELLVEASINYDGNIINIVNSANGNKPRAGALTGSAELCNHAQSLPAWLPGPMNCRRYGSAPWHNAAEDYEPKVDLSYTMASTP